jgi:hypothetical protein
VLCRLLIQRAAEPLNFPFDLVRRGGHGYFILIKTSAAARNISRKAAKLAKVGF